MTKRSWCCAGYGVCFIVDVRICRPKYL